MNTLYALLTSRLGNTPTGTYYEKLHTNAAHTPRSERITNEFIQNIPDDRLHNFACFICSLCMTSTFSTEINKLDSDNTYKTYRRNPQQSPESRNDCMYDLALPANKLKAISKQLDQDIQDRLTAPSYQEYASAICLQLLREAGDPLPNEFLTPFKEYDQSTPAQ